MPSIGRVFGITDRDVVGLIVNVSIGVCSAEGSVSANGVIGSPDDVVNGNKSGRYSSVSVGQLLAVDLASRAYPT